MGKPLLIGDLVTVVSKTDSLFTLVKRVTIVAADSSGDFLACVGDVEVAYQNAHEGVNWIRGAHGAKTDDVRALLAAHALVY